MEPTDKFRNQLNTSQMLLPTSHSWQHKSCIGQHCMEASVEFQLITASNTITHTSDPS